MKNQNIFKREKHEEIQLRQKAIGTQPKLTTKELLAMDPAKRSEHIANERYFLGDPTPKQASVSFDSPDALLSANIHPKAIVEGGVTIGSGVTVERDSHVGEDVNLGAGSSVGMGAKVPAGTQVGPGATIPDRTWVKPGSNVPAGTAAENALIDGRLAS